MLKTVFKYGSFLVFFLILGSEWVFAQCPMCKAAVESSSDGGGLMAENLNIAILYILVLPYLMIMGVGLLWYRKYRQKKAALNSAQ
ncbi:MAG: hypothetical protein H6581_12285 [Bacteroidia bacterium]|nr:hypothetical protein [Bacteroidia bacterium]